VIAVPRTGSSRVIRTLSGFDGLFVKGEIFNPHGVQNIARTEEPLVRTFLPPHLASLPSEKLPEWVRANCRRIIAPLLERAGDRTFVFKLMRGQIEEGEAASILTRPDLAALVVWRKPIDSYISLLKAKQVGAWGRVDTTELTVEASIDDFEKTCATWRRWYRTVAGLFLSRRIRFADLDYSSDRSDEDLAGFLSVAMSSLNVAAGEWQPPETGMFRQDRETDYARKVSNWQAFIDDVRRRGLESMAFKDRGLA
jgi:hypothetical protein